MKTKIIPFDIDLARKIQSGEIEGTIKTKNGLTCKIVSYCNGTDFFVERKTEANTFRWCYPYIKDGRYIDGKNNGGTDYDLVLEVPDNELQEPQFKPFDKVLVRKPELIDPHDIYEPDEWIPTLFQGVSDDGCYFIAEHKEWKECIPYAGNESLVGTTDKPE